MRYILTLITLLLVGCSSQSRFTTYQDGEFFYSGFNEYETRKRVVVIDTGLAPQFLVDKYMCRDTAQISLVKSLTVEHLHGTNVISIIKDKMNIEDFCITSVKLSSTVKGLLSEVSKLFNQASKLKRISIVNMSLQNMPFSLKDYNTIRDMVSNRISVNVAAGNYSIDLDAYCSTYPACYGKLLERDNATSGMSKMSIRSYFKVIGAQADYTNYGSEVDVFLYGESMGTPLMRGTSQATALYTNMMVRKSEN